MAEQEAGVHAAAQRHEVEGPVHDRSEALPHQRGLAVAGTSLERQGPLRHEGVPHPEVEALQNGLLGGAVAEDDAV